METRSWLQRRAQGNAGLPQRSVNAGAKPPQVATMECEHKQQVGPVWKGESLFCFTCNKRKAVTGIVPKWG